MGRLRCSQRPLLFWTGNTQIIIRKGRIYPDEDRSFYELVASPHFSPLSLSKSRSPKGMGRGAQGEKPCSSKRGLGIKYFNGGSVDAIGKLVHARSPCDVLWG